MEEIEAIFHKISSLQDKFNSLLEEIHAVHAFDENIVKTETKLEELEKQVQETVKASQSLITQTKESYLKKQNLIPSDIDQEFTALELLSERVQGNMESKQKEFKRAKTVRTDYLAGVDDIQRWLMQAEMEVQDRSL